MSQRFFVIFTAGNPQEFAGLSPTFITFLPSDGSSLGPPPIAEVGTSTGFYGFTFAPSATFSICFTVDGGVSVVGDEASRYITGVLDPIAAVDKELGFSADSYGSTIQAVTVFGQVKRSVELTQASELFDKTTGVWTKYAAGTSTVLMEKTLTNSISSTTKT